jgi:hypothetical protein
LAAELRPYVEAQRRFYERTAASARWGYLVTETVALVSAAAVPVAAAANAPLWVPAVFGAVAAITTGLRQVFEYRQNWILRSVALVTIDARIAAYRAKSDPEVTQALIDEVAGIAMAETDRWRALANQARQALPKEESPEGVERRASYIPPHATPRRPQRPRRLHPPAANSPDRQPVRVLAPQRRRTTR